MERAPQQGEIRTRSDAFQLLEALKNSRRQRSAQGRFLVEGVRSIDALRAAPPGRFRIDAFLRAEGRELSRWARDVLATSSARQHLALATPLMDALSDKDDPSELLAVLEVPRPALTDLALGDPPLIVVADRLTSPGNLGTLLRSCDAFGADAVIVSGRAADPTDPQTVRAAAGSWFARPIVSSQATALWTWIDRLRARSADLQVVGSSASGPRPIGALNLRRPTVLVVGSERAGLSRDSRERCDEIVSIPIQGTASSLNVACAASILLYEVSRQRAAHGP